MDEPRPKGLMDLHFFLNVVLPIILLGTVIWVSVFVLYQYDKQIMEYCVKNNLTCNETCNETNIICGGDLCINCRYNASDLAKRYYNLNSTYEGLK